MEQSGGQAGPEGQLFYDAFKASPIGIVLEDLTGRPLFVNPAFCAMLGFSEEELRQKHCVDFSPTEDAEKDWNLFQQLQSGLIDHYQLEKRYFRRDGSLIWGRLSISLFNDGTSRLVVAMIEDITEKRAAQEEVLQSQQILQKLAGQLMRAQEEERARIARELHDDINQRLALLGMKLNQLEDDPQISPATIQARHFGSTETGRRPWRRSAVTVAQSAFCKVAISRPCFSGDELVHGAFGTQQGENRLLR